MWYDVLIALLGRDRVWRLGRTLYMRARGEKRSNAIGTNGEAALIRNICGLVERSETPVFWDVGANCGEWSCAVLDAAAPRAFRLEVFEPTPEAAVLLEAKFPPKTDVHVHQVALSDRDGTAQFAVVGATAGTNSLEIESVGHATKVVEVKVAEGAHYASQLGIDRIDLLKIDTEGHDFSVLEGFEPMFRRQAIGIAQFEYNSRWIFARRSLRDVFVLAQNNDYALGRVHPRGIELFDRWNPECDRYFEDNYALVSRAWRSAPFVHPYAWSDSNTLKAFASRTEQ